ncbi:MAG: hypothetical protein EOM67_04120 [Spirochaetia bacterium]|nr:hypothetical protein [Spirochaetia bacterium]
MRELLPMFLSVILFIITLVVIATLRKSDDKNRKIEHIKKFVNQYSEKMNITADMMKTSIVEVESKLERVKEDTAVAVVRIQKEKEELFSHLQDLQELQATIVQYHSVLSSLSDMTDNVESRLSIVKLDILEIKKVESLIANFTTSIQESSDSMDQLHQSLHSSMDFYQTKIDSLIDSSIEQLASSFEIKRKEFIENTNPLLTQLNSMVSSLFSEVHTQGQKVEDQISALQHAKGIAISDLKSHLIEAERELEMEKKSLKELQEERGIIQSLISNLKSEEQQQKEQLKQTEIMILGSKEELHNTLNNITNSQEEFNMIQHEVEVAKTHISGLEDEKKILEDEIAEALRIKEQLQKEEELASLIEREKIDYPEFYEEEESVDELIEDIEEESEEQQEGLFDTLEEQSPPYTDEKEVDNQVNEDLDKKIDLSIEKIEEQEDLFNPFKEENPPYTEEEESEQELEEDQEFEDIDESEEQENDFQKKKNIFSHEKLVHEKEEDEEEIIIDEDDD